MRWMKSFTCLEIEQEIENYSRLLFTRVVMARIGHEQNAENNVQNPCNKKAN